MRHRFHALCPYFAMFPESFAEQWIDAITRPNDLVLDPFCGRGTAPFQSLLMGRQAVGNDVNPVACCVTRAKTNAPALSTLRRRITVLEAGYEADAWRSAAKKLPEFFSVAFSRGTLTQLLYLRDKVVWQTNDTDCMLAAIILGALHGESEKSPSYLSNQMPRTISTKPAYSVRFWRDRGLVAPARNAFDLVRTLASYRYASERPDGRARVVQGDMRDLHKVDFGGPVRAVITSPPYLDVTNFEEDQWLRLWFLGGPPHPTRRRVSRDDRHESRDGYWRMISDMWRTLGQVVDARGHVVIRIGGKGLRPSEIVDGLEGTSAFAGRKIVLRSHEVSPMRGRQTRSFRPGLVGLASEVDCHFRVN